MASLVPFLLLLALLPCTIAQPSPGYFPSRRFRPAAFGQFYSNLWGPQHQRLSQDQSALTIWLDKSSGSGFKSLNSYRNGYFSAFVKLQAGYTAGVNTAFYLSNNQQYPGYHDEIDIEFLGTIPGEPYTLQTNVYVRGSGDGKLIGREMRFHLWFDPTTDYHHYALLWNPDEIIFYVDDIPIRRYENKVDGTFPNREMWMYGSIWDASDWATDNGKYRADYQYQPFIARFKNFEVGGCTTDSSTDCRPVPASPTGSTLSDQQYQAMLWAQKNSMTYYYCQDSSKDRSLYPEC
ncbi:Xyloglucan endotransglucosylase/hydrolase [Rhynchospora pubera]|uniref:Xyloglucan endotransglucosylase/hydrolase n=1 Tax=Rhynchospora pubera TaxID=906938 RepID=A0AAV8DXM5_9POAL|nr:Xyloglucan endotransglucosylase/hydrolase [Rhynchospora pubera]KAJ4777803.1 Xyloglucan endotransglucosylase/hydrolase [Rhynchospora pubera]KAJ4802992.1 Xyloglucan endotransglucosylase/hydrolase [Rhynchospora pubera]